MVQEKLNDPDVQKHFGALKGSLDKQIQDLRGAMSDKDRQLAELEELIRVLAEVDEPEERKARLQQRKTQLQSDSSARQLREQAAKTAHTDRVLKLFSKAQEHGVILNMQELLDTPPDQLDEFVLDKVAGASKKEDNQSNERIKPLEGGGSTGLPVERNLRDNLAAKELAAKLGKTLS